MDTRYHLIIDGRKSITKDPHALMQAFDGRVVLDHYRGLLQLGNIPQPPIPIGWTLNRTLMQLMKRPGWPVYPSDLVRGTHREPMNAGALRVACHRLNKLFAEHGYGKVIHPGSYAMASVESDGSKGRFINPDPHELYVILGPVKPSLAGNRRNA